MKKVFVILAAIFSTPLYASETKVETILMTREITNNSYRERYDGVKLDIERECIMLKGNLSDLQSYTTIGDVVVGAGSCIINP